MMEKIIILLTIMIGGGNLIALTDGERKFPDSRV